MTDYSFQFEDLLMQIKDYAKYYAFYDYLEEYC